jgi:hypothetical protein
MITGNKSAEMLAVDVRVTDKRLWVRLTDDREVSVPLSIYPTLQHASASQRRRWELIGDGDGIHWPAIDYDLSVEGIVLGRPERFPEPPHDLVREALARKNARPRSSKTRKTAASFRRAGKVRK